MIGEHRLQLGLADRFKRTAGCALDPTLELGDRHFVNDGRRPHLRRRRVIGPNASTQSASRSAFTPNPAASYSDSARTSTEWREPLASVAVTVHVFGAIAPIVHIRFLFVQSAIEPKTGYSIRKRLR